MTAGSELILASASPRRLELLAQIGVRPELVVPPAIDELPQDGELPAAYVQRMAELKARTVSSRHSGVFILGADTVVAVGRRLLPKPRGIDEARCHLQLLSGRRHRVYTGLHVIAADGRKRGRLVATTVAFKRLARDEVEAYLASGEWEGKAGGYAIQGRAGAFIKRLIGSYSNVVGLPLYELRSLLSGLGWPANCT